MNEYVDKKNNDALQFKFDRTNKTLNFVIEDIFFIENEKELEKIGSFFDGKDNLYFLFVAKESLNLFIVHFNLEESKFHYKPVGKLPIKSSHYQAEVQVCNSYKKEEETDMIWFVLTGGEIFKIKVNLNNETGEISKYRSDGHYQNTTLFMADNIPCTAGGGPSKRLFTHDADPCNSGFFLFERENPLAFGILDNIYLIGGNHSNQTNLVEFCKLPNFNSPYNPATYTRNWKSLLRYSVRSTFDNNDFASNINAKDCSACIVGTKINIFSLDGFKNGYFYS